MDNSLLSQCFNFTEIMNQDHFQQSTQSSSKVNPVGNKVKKNNNSRIQQRQIERKAYEDLRQAIPTISTTQRPTRLVILKHSCEYIKMLEQMLSKLEEEKNRLKMSC